VTPSFLLLWNFTLPFSVLLYYQKHPVTEDTGQIFKTEEKNNRNRVSHAIIKQYFAEHEIAQEFIRRMEQEQPKYFIAIAFA
jgi:hypothetical protein